MIASQCNNIFFWKPQGFFLIQIYLNFQEACSKSSANKIMLNQMQLLYGIQSTDVIPTSSNIKIYAQNKIVIELLKNMKFY